MKVYRVTRQDGVWGVGCEVEWSGRPAIQTCFPDEPRCCLRDDDILRRGFTLEEVNLAVKEAEVGVKEASNITPEDETLTGELNQGQANGSLEPTPVNILAARNVPTVEETQSSM